MYTCMRKSHSVFLAGCLLMLVPIAGQTSETPGTAMCKRAAPGAPCSTAWDFTAAPRALYWVERFVYDSSEVEWQSVAGPFAGTEGATDETMKGGFLYRVVGCNDKTKAIDCIGSTVFWAPVRPRNLDDIPDAVTLPDGGKFTRNRRHSAEMQVLDYNLALIAKLVETVDMSSMPPMTELPFTDLRYDVPAWMSQLDATIDYNVYEKYAVKGNRQY